MQNVKSTMIDGLLSYVAPHPCSGCGKIGTLLCDNCKYNIISDVFLSCVACGGLAGRHGICSSCQVPYKRAWCVGERVSELRKLIDEYKFQNVYAAYTPLAELLSERLGQLPAQTVVVPVPTVASHIRQRGYDHTLLIAQSVARQCGLQVQTPLERASSTMQRGANRAKRVNQAKNAFKVRGRLDSNRPYLLIDDITTTGATLIYGTKALREAGANEVWVGVVARQPLD